MCIPSVRDRIVQAAVLQLIEPVLEKEFEECSFAYRKGRSVKQAVYKVREYYEQGYQWVVDADIDAFFDSVDYSLLLLKFKCYIHDPCIQNLVGLWLKGEVWDGKTVTTLKKGIPQGSPISRFLQICILMNSMKNLLVTDISLCDFQMISSSFAKIPEWQKNHSN
ncbi:reverse transcriptase/maturase family protein [Candidatus Kuenenia stuttgartiensis]|uniref:reverse transcriptase/maturase family protein n=1 Tax=Kuenenia stuttgartiensis TaxID=174633 RepID=UPI001B8AB7DF|nr:reverse transcriptase/maturase family protein [Candidatus Kuenenia stuttgartiensis]